MKKDKDNIKELFDDGLNDQIKTQLLTKNLRRITKNKELSNYVVGKTLGHGSMGKVKLAKHSQTGQLVAIKFINKKNIIDEQMSSKVEREIDILKVLRHPNLIQLYEIFETPTQILIVTEYCEGGELYEMIINKGKIYEFDAAKIFWQILTGVEYLHNNKIAHRDIKAENIALGPKGIPKLIDFSLSNFQKNGIELLRTPCGSPEYAAPEMIQGKKYNGFFSDLWSCGVLLFAMVSGYLPFENENLKLLYEQIINCELFLPDFLTPECKDMIQLLLNVDPNLRPQMKQLRKHPWFKKNKVFNLQQIYTVQIKLHVHTGVHIGEHIIPVDSLLVKQTEKSGYKMPHIKFSVENNNHTRESAVYYQFLNQHIQSGAKSPADISCETFKPKQIKKSPSKTSLAAAPQDKKNTLTLPKQINSSRQIRLSQQNTINLAQSPSPPLPSQQTQGNISPLSLTHQSDSSQQEKRQGLIQLIKPISMTYIPDEQNLVQKLTTINDLQPEIKITIKPEIQSEIRSEVEIKISQNDKNKMQMSPTFFNRRGTKRPSYQKIIVNDNVPSIESESDQETEEKQEKKRIEAEAIRQKQEQAMKDKEAKEIIAREEAEQQILLLAKKKEHQRQIELFYRQPQQGLKIINKAQAKRYIIKSPYKPNQDNSKTFHLMFYNSQTTSTIDQLMYDSGKNTDIRKVYQNTNYSRINDDKKKDRAFFSIDSKMNGQRLNRLNCSQPVKRSHNQTARIFSETPTDYRKSVDKLDLSALSISSRDSNASNLKQSKSDDEGGTSEKKVDFKSDAEGEEKSDSENEQKSDLEVEIKVSLDNPPTTDNQPIIETLKKKKKVMKRKKNSKKSKQIQITILPIIESKEAKDYKRTSVSINAINLMNDGISIN